MTGPALNKLKFPYFCQKLTGLMKDFNFNAFVLKDDYFDHPSLLHGINHTYRVMMHVIELGKSAGLNHEIREAFCAAFIHDMARQHDGYCTQHGTWAAQKKLPFFSKMFLDAGVSTQGLENIRLAVTNHSLYDEIDPTHPAYKTVALLKDADALDRIRISKNNLKPEFLRFPQSSAYITFARDLYYASNQRIFRNFDELLAATAHLDRRVV
jgi:hypothetical protein